MLYYNSMIKLIPEEILKTYKKIQEANFEIYLVGGCVRNMLLKKPVKDWDMTTNAVPEQMLKIFPKAFYDNKFGTVGIPIKNGIIEITTFRTEHGYSDKRRPDSVKWGKTIEEDLARRDFTINAIALRITTNEQLLTTNLIDPYEGQKDIENKIIRAVGNPKERFKEDALRLLRAVRIATEISFTIDDATWKEMVTDSPLIKHVSGERIRIEFLRILRNERVYEGIMLLKDSNLLNYILPELIIGIGISQTRPGRHHTDDVFTHNVLSLKFCPSTDPVVRFSALLHDVGKPKVMSKDKDNLVIFHNHEVAGAKIAAEICERLKFSKIDKDRVVNLIRWHMFGVNENQTDSAIRRFIRKIGVGNVKDMLDIRIADRLGSGRPADSWRLKLFKEKVEEQLKPAKFSINDLAIDGNDIMRELKIKPGPKIGEILQQLFTEVDENLSRNNKEFLLKRIKELA
ncbi:MAG: tRNA adenylyl-/cytidylyl-transferase [Candidatus Levybacteria bacterium GW2011_GWA1_37_16]|nr:MAG: tRNA adenylyl-/cytidylyl-transferase [Candidatus Levybacteria bacterium GW2011_GWA1_37_16]KKQ42024.1 MAG: tRNA adenylyl-/cytidylyl-transferase [Candidatus Levybacteria bacterium GW2011_GWB1_37_8]